MEVFISIMDNFAYGIIWGGIGIFFVMKFLFPSYLKEKGKNLATKEDIEGITQKIELVKSDYAKVLEEVKTNNQLMLSEIDRQKKIKKEVFMNAVDAITKNHIFISLLSNLDINDSDISFAMLSNSGTIAKIQVVGSENTVESVNSIMSSIGKAIIELMFERITLINRKNKIEFLKNQRNKSENEIDRYIVIMKNLNLEGNFNQRLWTAIQDNIDFEKDQINKCNLELDNSSKIQKKEHTEFVEKCMNYFFKTSDLLPHAILSVRKELNLDISDERFIDMFQQEH